MKKLLLVAIIMTSTSWGCPTCVGRINPQSPPYFSQDFYKPHQSKTPDIDLELKERIKQWTQNSDHKELAQNSNGSEGL